MVHRITTPCPTNGNDSGTSTTAAVSEVLRDVEEYLVTNLVELERAGANGTTNTAAIQGSFSLFRSDHPCSMQQLYDLLCPAECLSLATHAGVLQALSILDFAHHA